MILTHFKNNWKWYLITVLLGLIIFMQVRFSNLEAERNSLSDAMEYQKTEAKVWRDAAGKSHAENKTLKLDNATFKKLYEAELKRDFSIKPDGVAVLAKVSTVNSGTVKIPVSKNTFDYQPNKWINFKGSLKDSTLKLDWNLTDSLTFITAHRKRLFKPDVYFVEAVSHNPYVTMKGLQYIQVEEKPKRFGLGVGVSVVPDEKFKPVVRPAISLQYNFLRF
jgi:dTDP-4-dehydrorhamnose 3,5-epimerase-like enzyme